MCERKRFYNKVEDCDDNLIFSIRLEFYTPINITTIYCMYIYINLYVYKQSISL